MSNTTTPSGLRLPRESASLRRNFTWRYYYSGEFPFSRAAVQHVRWRRFAAAHALLAPYQAPGLLVDAGCGPGESTVYLAHRLGAGAALGVDISPDCCWFATELARANQSPARFVVASATRLPVPSAQADLVVSFEMIEHLPNWRTFVAEAARALRPGGLLLLSTPNAFSLHALLKAVYRRIRGFARLNRAWRKDGDFYEAFLPDRMIQRGLEEAGFALLDRRHVAFVLTVQPDWTLRPARTAESVLERTPGLRRLAVTSVLLARKR